MKLRFKKSKKILNISLDYLFLHWTLHRHQLYLNSKKIFKTGITLVILIRSVERSYTNLMKNL